MPDQSEDMTKIAKKGDLPPEAIYKKVAISKVHENTWNPNHVSDANYGALKHALDLAGGNHQQPVMVRPHPTLPDEYEIVDGAHRYRGMKELGFEELMVIVEVLTDKQARLKTIAMNKLRGEFDSIELAELIIELKNNYGVTDAEFKEMAGYTDDEIKGFESLVNFDDSMFDTDLPDEPDSELPGVSEDLIIPVTPDQKEAILKLPEIFGIKDLSLAVAAAANYIAVQNETGALSQALAKSSLEWAAVGNNPENQVTVDDSF